MVRRILMIDKKNLFIKEYLSKVKQASKEYPNVDLLNESIINPLQKVLTATPACHQGRHLGKLRLDIKKHLFAEMKEIDGLVKTVVG